MWSAHANSFGVLIGYLGGCNVGLKGWPFRSEQQSLSSPDSSNPQAFGGDELLKSKIGFYFISLTVRTMKSSTNVL